MALQSELFTSLMDTRTPLAVVDPDVLKMLLLLLLLLPELLLLKLPAYPPRYNEMPPPHTCAQTSRHSASHTHRQYKASNTDPKALTLAPNENNERPLISARRRRVRSGKLKQAGTAKTYD